MAASWLQVPERSASVVMGLMSWIARYLGRSFARVLLYPITLYFFLFSHTSRRASMEYLQRLLATPPRRLDVFRHYHCFASTILDRVYLLSGRDDLFDIHMHGRDVLRAYEKSGGCVLLGAHLGSFEVLRCLGSLRFGLPISVLMYEENARKFGSLLRAMNPELANRIIPIGLPDTLIRVKEALERGELVGMLGDRAVTERNTIVCNFLGEHARFPTGPVRIASLFGVPVVLFFGLYRGGNRYDVHFEMLAENLSEARNSSELIPYWTERYVERLEHYCRLAPYNWFNFYDFWALPGDNVVRPTS